jgi:hypothetical protein
MTPPASPSYTNSNDNINSSDEDDMDLADDSIKEELFLEGYVFILNIYTFVLIFSNLFIYTHQN